MKKSVYILATLLVFSYASPALAENSVRDTIESKVAEFQSKIRENQQKIVDARDQFKSVASSTKAEVRDLHREDEGMRMNFKVDIAKHQAEIAGKVFQATLDRMSTLITRIESRIAKIKAAGGDTSPAESSVAAAKADITDAKAHIAIITSTDISGATTTAATRFEAVKTEAMSVRKDLIDAKQNLMRAVQSLHGLGDGEDKSATSTTSTKPERD